MAGLIILGVYLADRLIDMRARTRAAGGCDAELCTPDNPCVLTLSGCTRGRLHHIELADERKVQVKSFLGIPYAAPPVGDLRLADPVPIAPWGSKVYDAFNYNRSCHCLVDTAFPGFAGAEMWDPPGGVANMSEDCLYLNVWVPEGPTEKMSVMVWIFGGGYFSGSSALDVYRGQFLATSQSLVVVSMNYRLGSLGFLATGDGHIAGNFGLKDQRLAIQWVHNNIEKFGGNPESVTLFGESAGAASIGYHLVNNITSKYFHRAVMHSASQLSPWAYIQPDNVKLRAKKLLENLGCNNSDSREGQMLCLRKQPAAMFRTKDWVINNVMLFPWAPTRDGDFIRENPLHDLLKTDIAKKKLIFASNADEGTFWIIYNFPQQFYLSTAWINITRQQLKDDFEILTVDIPPQADKTKLYNVYAGSAPPGDGRRNSKLLDLVLGDRHFTCPVEHFAQVYKGQPRYYLQYYYRDSLETWSPWLGVIHGADCQWVFGAPLDKQRHYLQTEVHLANSILQYYGNFARTGDPNGATLATWPEYSSTNKRVLRISPDGTFRDVMFSQEEYPREDVCRLWNALEQTSQCCKVAV